LVPSKQITGGSLFFFNQHIIMYLYCINI